MGPSWPTKRPPVEAARRRPVLTWSVIKRCPVRHPSHLDTLCLLISVQLWPHTSHIKRCPIRQSSHFRFGILCLFVFVHLWPHTSHIKRLPFRQPSHFDNRCLFVFVQLWPNLLFFFSDSWFEADSDNGDSDELPSDKIAYFWFIILGVSLHWTFIVLFLLTAESSS
jgi:hypothetical protein